MKSGGFAWWEPHDRATRAARRLFALVAVVLAIYLLAPAVVVVICLRAAEVGPWHAIRSLVDDLGIAGVALCFVVAIGLVAGAVAFVGWRGFPQSTRRLATAREPKPDELRATQATIEAFALAHGMHPPLIFVVDDPAPNAFAFGRAAASGVCVTTGALHLPKDELAALCMFHVTALRSRLFAYATATADLLLVAEWWTRVLWASAVFVLLSAIVGVPPEAVGACVFGLMLLVVATKPILSIADRALPRLLDQLSERVDLETVRLSAQPDALARLLLRLLQDGKRVHSRWEIAHLWFERDAVVDMDAPSFAHRCLRDQRRRLLDRAQLAINQTGDPGLQVRLDQVH